jgi:D-amino peptidase
LAHTINSFAFASISLNGQELGEAGLYGALAGEYGVPVVMGSGDDVFIAENRPLFPHATFVETKKATGFGSGVSLSPEQSRRAIRAGVAEGLAARANASRWSCGPADRDAARPVAHRWPTCSASGRRFERVDGVTLRFTARRWKRRCAC